MPASEPSSPTGRTFPTGRTSRRAALAVLASVFTAVPLLGACGVRWVSGPEPTPEPDRSPDDVAREAAVADAQELLGLLTAAAAGAAPLSTIAESAAQTCAAHLVALGGPATPSSSSSSSSSSSAPAAALEAQEVVDRLAAAATSAREDGSVLLDVTGPMARLLASVAASRTLLAEAVAAATGTVTPTSPSLTGATPTETQPEGSDKSPGTVALQAALAGEHAAVFGYALVVGRVGDRRAEAEADLAAHRIARDDLVDVLLARGADPVQASASYDAQAPTPESAAALAATLEERLAATYADVVAASTDDRLLGANALVTAARDGRRWGSTVVAFPGLPELGEDGSPVPTVTAATP